MDRRDSLPSKGTVKIFFMAILSLFSASQILAKSSISYTPSSPNVEEAVTFTLTPPGKFMGSVQWDFGDGNTASGGTSITHKYLSAKAYVVKASVFSGGSWIATTTKIAVAERRKITYAPSSPKQNETVIFHAENFLSVLIKWDFGDGTKKNRGKAIETHQYAAPGSYTVTATDFNGTSCCPINTTVQVAAAPAPYISFSPPSPKTGEEVTFVAYQFTSKTLIKWDFGDGVVQNDTSPPTITHTYSSPGTYQVKAYDKGGDVVTASKTLRVKAAPEPSISYTPASPKPGEEISFTAHHFTSITLIRWDFGDGAVVNDNSPPSITHVYRGPGTFQVKAYDNGGEIITAKTSVRVRGAERFINYTPADPRINEDINFRANNFFSTEIKWDFGDGRTIPGGTLAASHAYQIPGNYTVQAWDYYGQQPAGLDPQALLPVTTRVAVTPDLRMISCTPTPALTGKEVTLTAINFRSTVLRWDFGDGNILENGTPAVTHIYKKEGFYTVTAYDHGGRDKYPISVEMTVLPQKGPTAPFSISFLQIRFEDGKAYKHVPKDFQPLVSYADIKFEGTGILEAQWIVDGKPFQTASLAMPYARQETINSGRTSLPTLLPGIHEVTLSITQPRPEFQVPTIRYFVSAEEGEARVEVSISRVKDLETEGIITVEENRLRLAASRDYLVSGTIKNVSENEIPSLLFEVSLANKILDQQKINGLKPGELRSFETSFLNDSNQRKSLILQAYDTSPDARILGSKKLNVITPAPEPEIPTPDITSLNPSQAELLSGSVNLIINGTGFIMGSGVYVQQAGNESSRIAYAPSSVDSTQLHVTLEATWTSQVQALEVMVSNPVDDGWVSSDWVPFFVVPRSLPPQPLPRSPEIRKFGPEITSLNPNSYYRGTAIGTLIIEGKNFVKSDFEVQIVTVMVYATGWSHIALYANPADYPQSITPTRIECSVPLAAPHSEEDLKVRVDLDGWIGSEHYRLQSEPALMTCLGTAPRIATLSPDKVTQGHANSFLYIYPPNDPYWKNCFKGTSIGGAGNPAFEIRRVNGPVIETLYDVICMCGNPLFSDSIWVMISPQWTSEVGDYEVRVGNSDGQGGYIWSNSLIFSVVSASPYSAEPLGKYPDTEITNVTEPSFPFVPRQISWRGIEREVPIMGYEWVFTYEDNEPGEWHWAETFAPSLLLNEVYQTFNKDGNWTFRVRAVDINGRRDPTSAKHTFEVDQRFILRITLTEVRVDDDAEPSGQKGEVFFAWESFNLSGELSPPHYFPGMEEADYVCDPYPRYNLYQIEWCWYHPCPELATWKMDSGDVHTVSETIDYDVDYPFPPSPITRKVLVGGFECDDQENQVQSLGALILNVHLRQLPSGYEISLGGVNWEPLIPNEAHTGFMSSYLDMDDQPGGYQLPTVGAFTIFYSIERF